jgi:hypothetical protein
MALNISKVTAVKTVRPQPKSTRRFCGGEGVPQEPFAENFGVK